VDLADRLRAGTAQPEGAPRSGVKSKADPTTKACSDTSTALCGRLHIWYETLVAASSLTPLFLRFATVAGAGEAHEQQPDMEHTSMGKNPANSYGGERPTLLRYTCGNVLRRGCRCPASHPLLLLCRIAPVGANGDIRSRWQHWVGFLFLSLRALRAAAAGKDAPARPLAYPLLQRYGPPLRCIFDFGANVGRRALSRRTWTRLLRWRRRGKRARAQSFK
jgi:hypothetical protein